MFKVIQLGRGSPRLNGLCSTQGGEEGEGLSNRRPRKEKKKQNKTKKDTKRKTG